MQRNTDKRVKKIAPIICASLVIGILVLYLSIVFGPVLSSAYGDFAGIIVLLLAGVIWICVIVGVIIALRQRLKEIEGGEEEDAKKY